MSLENAPSPEATQIDIQPPNAHVPTLYRHAKRTQWGLGIVLEKGHDRIRVQFQDGRSRSFKHGYYHLFEPVDRRLDVAMGIVEALRSMSGETSSRPSEKKRPVTLDEQIAYFAELYPEGFEGEEYTAEHRGDERKRPLKRHRDALIALAKEELDKKALSKLLKDGDTKAVWEAAGRVVASTDLVKVAERKRFLAIKKTHHDAVANGLHALLHGQSPITQRFDAMVAWLERAMGEAPSWELATVLLGAFHPDEHVVVRENVFSRQAVWMAAGLTIPKRPMGILYERLLNMAKTVREELEGADMAPRDLLDVHDFMWLTLKPAAQKKIREQRRLDGPLASKGSAKSDQEAA